MLYNTAGNSIVLGSPYWVLIPTSPLTNWMTIGKLLASLSFSFLLYYKKKKKILHRTLVRVQCDNMYFWNYSAFLPLFLLPPCYFIVFFTVCLCKRVDRSSCYGWKNTKKRMVNLYTWTWYFHLWISNSFLFNLSHSTMTIA